MSAGFCGSFVNWLLADGSERILKCFHVILDLKFLKSSLEYHFESIGMIFFELGDQKLVMGITN